MSLRADDDTKDELHVFEEAIIIPGESHILANPTVKEGESGVMFMRQFSSRFLICGAFNPSIRVAGLFFVFMAFIAGCGSGSNSATPPMSPPTNLSYAQPSISAVVGQAVTADAPAVTGTVTSYAVSPGLPAGLSVNKTTGMIDGTPTAATAKASYSVTASNSAGATTTTVQITVANPLPAPTGLLYPQTVIETFVGQALTPDIPAPSGTITAYTVSPALPPGLSIDPSTGVISGSPTAVSAQATYVVTGSNSGGSVPANVSPTITVNAPPTILLQADNQYGVTPEQGQNGSALQFVNSSVFSEDGFGVWVLRDYTSGDLLASGGATGAFSDGVSQMAGPTLAINIAGGVQVVSSATGNPLGTIVSPAWVSQPVEVGGSTAGSYFWTLASDGSYIAVATQTSLSVFSPTGQLQCTKSGDYLDSGSGSLFAAPGQVQVANGPAGANIETIAVPSCASTVSAAYQGPYPVWFTDGSRFLTASSNGTVWVYSSAGALQATVQIPIPEAGRSYSPGPLLGGAGNWIWTFGYYPLTQETSLTVYPVGSSTAALTETSAFSGFYQASGTTLGVLPDPQTVSVIDLSGAAPVRTDYSIPATSINTAVSYQSPVTGFAAISSSHWIAATGTGPILDGASLATSTPRYLGRGGVLSAAGSTAIAALATGNGQITTFEPSNTTPVSSIGMEAGEMALSTDGSVLAASSPDDTVLNIYSLPSGTLSDSLSYPTAKPGPSTTGPIWNFTLAGSGDNLGVITVDNAATYPIYTPQVLPVSGSPVIWSGSPVGGGGTSGPIFGSAFLSPDGTLAAVSEGSTKLTSTVSIYQNGQLLAAVNGIGVGWLDNGRLLVNNYVPLGLAYDPQYSNSTIYSPTGSSLATVPLAAELASIQPVTSDTVYSPGKNAIYSLTSGQATWTSPYLPDAQSAPPGGGVGVVAGSYVVFETEGRVIAVPY